MKTSKLFDMMATLLKNLTKQEVKLLKDLVDNLYNSLYSEELPNLESLDLAEEKFAIPSTKILDFISLSEEDLIKKFGYLPSQYQKAVLDWVANGQGNGIIKATAGSGKSTSLKQIAQTLEMDLKVPTSEILVLVFGKQNQEDLLSKFGNTWKNSVLTLNACGWRLVRQHLKLKGNQGNLSKFKYKNIAQELCLTKKSGKGLLKSQDICEEQDFFKILDFIRLQRLPLVIESIQKIAIEQSLEGIYDYQKTLDCVEDALHLGEFWAKEDFKFDFVDQIYLPLKWNLHCGKNFKKYSWVLIDECQDLNKAQTELVLALKSDEGRILAVGDEYQSIMGFAGADSDSFNSLRLATKAQELPLSVCYRCPKKHIELVKEIFPHIDILPAANSKDGRVLEIKEENLENELKNGDIVLSRKTAPLVNLCIQLISKSLPAKVKGRDIGEMLKKDFEEIAATPNFEYSKFIQFLNTYTTTKISKVKDLDNAEELIEKINDKSVALQTIYTSQLEAKSIQDLCSYVDNLFSDDAAPISLQTCHKSKGSEAERVFLYCPEDMPLIFKNARDSQIKQEYNLLFVALTRGKEDLFIVKGESKKEIKWLPSSFKISELSSEIA